MLQARCDELFAGLAPATSEAISRYVSALKVTMPSRATDEAGAAMEMRLTVKALETFPEWAIADVCRRYLDGRLGKGRFAPTPAEIAQDCRALLTIHQEEATKAKRILEAEVYTEATPEERERMLRLIREASRGLRSYTARNAKMGKPKRERSKEVIERAANIALIRMAKQAPPLPPLSESMRDKLTTAGHIRPQQAA